MSDLVFPAVLQLYGTSFLMMLTHAHKESCYAQEVQAEVADLRQQLAARQQELQAAAACKQALEGDLRDMKASASAQNAEAAELQKRINDLEKAAADFSKKALAAKVLCLPMKHDMFLCCVMASSACESFIVVGFPIW